MKSQVFQNILHAQFVLVLKTLHLSEDTQCLRKCTFDQDQELRCLFPAGQKYYGLLNFSFYYILLESCKLDFLKAFIWQVYSFFLEVHISQSNRPTFSDIRTFSTSALPKLKKTHTTNKNNPPPKSTNPPTHPKTPEKPNVYILILVVGNQAVLTKTPRVQTNVCMSVQITVLFFLSPIVLFGGYIIP